MRARRALRAVLAAALLSACAGSPTGGTDSPLPTCPTAAPAGPSPAPELPPAFPTPAGVTYTSAERAGPSTILEGHWAGASLGDAFEGYKRAFVEAGYQVTDEEREARDAEVNFAGGGTTGQVRLNVRCAGRLEVGITIRPGR